MAQAAKFSSLGKRAYELLIPLQTEVRKSIAGRRVRETAAQDSSVPLSYILTSEAASIGVSAGNGQDSTMATDWTALDPLFQAALYWYVAHTCLQLSLKLTLRCETQVSANDVKYGTIGPNSRTVIININRDEDRMTPHSDCESLIEIEI